MNIALFLQQKLLLGLHRFLSGAPTVMTKQPLPRERNHAQSTHTPCPATARYNKHAALTTRHPIAKVIPLRVLRVVDSAMPRSSTGRLVISGRMDDVCAELDRLVKREAAMH